MPAAVASRSLQFDTRIFEVPYKQEMAVISAYDINHFVFITDTDSFSVRYGLKAYV
jgi:hypothetical protein